MRKLSLSILAASIALIPTGAFAQGGPQGPHMRGGQMHGPNMQMRHGPMGGQHFQRRLQRGFVIPPMWFGPQFQINNWQAYGFADPGEDGRWVRYYDDAYLIDRGGRVMDSREDLDWDRYGEEWDMADGVPAYRGRDDRRGDEDYDRDEGHGDRGGHGDHHAMHHGGQGYVHGGGDTQVYGGGYGYGMYAYPIVIETVTTSGGGYMEEVVEEYVEVRHRARARPRCVCRRPAPPRPAPPPRPPAGERG